MLGYYFAKFYEAYGGECASACGTAASPSRLLAGGFPATGG